jgi:hypothetical protein
MNGTARPTNDRTDRTSGSSRGAGNQPPGGAGSPATSGATLAAWERFVGGEDPIRGVRPQILASWYRCREQYQVDPRLAQAPPALREDPAAGEPTLVHGTVYAELGGAAALAAADAEPLGGIITVTDSGGRILSAWGDRKTLGLAQESNLTPWFAWPEWTTGTNGMGTALHCHQPVTVQGAEHWCQGFHGWACAGVAIRDVATDTAIAVLNVSLRGPSVPGGLTKWLQHSATTVLAGLRERERASGIELVASFARAAAGASGPVAALDMAGRVVIANDEAGLLLGVPSRTPAANPATRWVAQVPELPALAQHAARQARVDPGWKGIARVYVPFTQALLPLSVTPVFMARQMIGMLVTDGGTGDGEPMGEDTGGEQAGTEQAGAEQGGAAQGMPPAGQGEPGKGPPRLPGRVVARREDRLVVLAVPEIRYAEAAGNIVWLATDQGRLRAAAGGLDHLEHDLAGLGFLRVHRRYLVNLRRVREIDQGFKGALFLITDVHHRDSVPVSRRHAPDLRRALGV